MYRRARVSFGTFILVVAVALLVAALLSYLSIRNAIAVHDADLQTLQGYQRATRLEPGGVVLVRDADASGGWRFTAVWLGFRFKALVLGSWRQPFHARTVGEWLACFANHGFLVDRRPMGQGTPFANVLFRLTASRGPEWMTGEK